ncbi:MAG: thiamine pyrophosphate-binding protein [Burkholderiaceae bacterium]
MNRPSELPADTAPPSDAPQRERHGGQLLADALIGHGVDTIFGVPGESYLAVLEGLYHHRAQSRFVICRQEGGAAYMADAYAKLTGKPGILMVTRGPGATNAAIGVHTAHQDSTPMVVLIGQVGAEFMDREAFQEIDYRRFYSPITKWSAQIDQVERIPEYIAQAMQRATSGRMGPVALALPENVLSGKATVADARRYTPVQATPAPDQMRQLTQMLAAARRPLVLLGGSGWTRQACEDLAAFVTRLDLPTACVFRRQDLLDNDHPCYVGDVGIGANPKLTAVREADLVIAIGPRLGEMTTAGYTLFDIPIPACRMVHVHPGVEELGRVYGAELLINSGMPQFAAALRDVTADSAGWKDQRAVARSAYEAWQKRPPVLETLSSKAPVALDLWQVMQDLQARLPRDTIVTNGAGNFATWGHRFWRYGPLRTQLAPTSGAMGYGLPAAVAASLAEPGRTVLCLAGDGDVMMNAQELATATQYGAKPLVLVFNNSMFGTIRMHQEREFPGNVLGTELVNPDFVGLARSFGGFGTSVQTTAEFDKALGDALQAIETTGRFALIEMKVDPQMITPGKSLDQISQGQ